MSVLKNANRLVGAACLRFAQTSVLVAVMLASSACVSSKQVQYFAARDSETGDIAFYRMTMEGGSGPLSDYTLKAGYFNSNSLDALTGTIQDPPEVSGDEKQLAAIESIRSDIYAKLKTWSEYEDPSRGDGPATDQELIQAARAFHIASLDRQSLASVGSSGSLDRYGYQKLVFWVESRTVDLSQLQAEFDNLLKNTESVVGSIKSRADERANKESKAMRVKALTSYVDALAQAVTGDVDREKLVDALRETVLALADPTEEPTRALASGLLESLLELAKSAASPTPQEKTTIKLAQTLVSMINSEDS